LEVRKLIRSVGFKGAEAQGLAMNPTIAADFMKKVIFYGVDGGFLGKDLREELLRIVMDSNGKFTVFFSRKGNVVVLTRMS
jgi:hypothetical protein